MAAKRGNRHDIWQRFYEKHHTLFEETGVPSEITRSENRFRDLLRDGNSRVGDVGACLPDLTAAQWPALVQLTEIYCNEFESYDPLAFFPAFGGELKARKDRLGL